MLGGVAVKLTIAGPIREINVLVHLFVKLSSFCMLLIVLFYRKNVVYEFYALQT